LTREFLPRPRRRGDERDGNALTRGNRFYCIWDSFRAQHPLLTIIDPPAQAEMIRTLVDVYRNIGRRLTIPAGAVAVGAY